MPKVTTDDLDALLNVLPPYISQQLSQREDRAELLELVLDLGRQPEARYSQGEVLLSQKEVSQEEIDYVVSRIGVFTDDNRAGIERTLHRISAIRNRSGRIVGLSCRVGRAVFGTIELIRDLVQSGNSILLLGRPGVGKTTMLREVARVLAEDLRKRVVVVDTSNEIAGDGDIPHPAIGRARRMQVPRPTMQHAVMIEAVENHMPEVVVIDEIGTELEAEAARTIAERGVQLVGTAHGNTLENLIMNPTLSDLVGGIQTVTLSDEEAKRRGTQKSILERKAPPTFDVVVEIQNRERVAIHPDVAAVVDAMLRGRLTPVESRWFDENGDVQTAEEIPNSTLATVPEPRVPRRPRRILPLGIDHRRLERAAQKMQLPLRLVDELSQADVVITSKSRYQEKPTIIVTAEAAGIPLYALKNNSTSQIEQGLAVIFGAGNRASSLTSALEEAKEAIRVVESKGNAIELSPQNAFIRRLQHQLAERNSLQSRSRGKEPRRRVRIFKEGD